MQTGSLGRSGLPVTRIGIGMAALGRPGYINLGHADDLKHDYDEVSMEQHAHDVLDAAYDAGIRYYDVARSYGLAEQFLASWLDKRQFLPGDISVGSKWGYKYTARWQVEADVHEVKEHSLPNLQKQWGETLSHVGVHLGLYQIHSATLQSGVLENVGVLNELARIKREMGIPIGLSLSGAGQAATLEKALSVRIDGEPLFGAVQATWNLLERSAGNMLQAAHNSGMGVIIKEVLANGRLTPRNDTPQFAEQFALLSQQAQRLNTTVDALAIAAALANDWADVVLSGAARIDHLQANVAALAVAWDEEAAAALAPLAEDSEAYWATRAQLAWN